MSCHVFVSRYSVIRIWRLIERLVTGFLYTDCLLQGVCYKRELYDAHYFLKSLNILSGARSLANVRMQEHSPNLVYSALKLSHRTHTGLRVGEIYLIKTCILCWDHPQAGQTTESIVFLVMYPLMLLNKIQYPLSVSNTSLSTYYTICHPIDVKVPIYEDRWTW